MKRKVKLSIIASVAVIAIPTVALAVNNPSDLEGWMQPYYNAQNKAIHAIFPYTDGQLHLDRNFTRYQAMFAFAKVQNEIDALNHTSTDEQQTISLAASTMASTGEVVVTPPNNPGVVYIGAGFLVKDTSHVLTDMHVIDERANIFTGYAHPKSIDVYIGNTDYKATIESYAIRRDMALLKLDKPVSGGVPLHIATSNPSVGSNVIAVGSPLGQTNSVTKGIVSNVFENPIPVLDEIQIDAALNPGNSGGPVVDYAGDVVGISDWAFVNNNQIADGMGVATSWREINAFLAGKSDDLPPQY